MTTRFEEKKATEWLLKADEFYPRDKIVLDLKEKLFNLKNNSDENRDEWKSLEAFFVSSLVMLVLYYDLFLYAKILTYFPDERMRTCSTKICTCA